MYSSLNNIRMIRSRAVREPGHIAPLEVNDLKHFPVIFYFLKKLGFVTVVTN